MNVVRHDDPCDQLKAVALSTFLKMNSECIFDSIISKERHALITRECEITAITGVLESLSMPPFFHQLILKLTVGGCRGLRRSRRPRRSAAMLKLKTCTRRATAWPSAAAPYGGSGCRPRHPLVVTMLNHGCRGLRRSRRPRRSAATLKLKTCTRRATAWP